MPQPKNIVEYVQAQVDRDRRAIRWYSIGSWVATAAALAGLTITLVQHHS